MVDKIDTDSLGLNRSCCKRTWSLGATRVRALDRSTGGQERAYKGCGFGPSEMLGQTGRDVFGFEAVWIRQQIVIRSTTSPVN